MDTKKDVREVELENGLVALVENVTNDEWYKNPRITYLDVVEDECWELFKEYAAYVGAKIPEDEEEDCGPCYSIAKDISEKIIDIVEEIFGVPFPTSKNG